LKIVGLDLLFSEELWTFEPTLATGTIVHVGHDIADSDVVFARLLTVHSSPVVAEVALVVGTHGGYTYAWRIDAATGKTVTDTAAGVGASASEAAIVGSTLTAPSKGVLTSVITLPPIGGEKEYLLVSSLNPSRRPRYNCLKSVLV
jgi:hypothetical protein